MATRSVTCVIPLCDVCGNSRPDEDGATPHLPTAAEAIAHAVRFGWDQLPDGRLVCDDPDLLHEQLRGEHGLWKPGRDSMTVIFGKERAASW